MGSRGCALSFLSSSIYTGAGLWYWIVGAPDPRGWICCSRLSGVSGSGNPGWTTFRSNCKTHLRVFHPRENDQKGKIGSEAWKATICKVDMICREETFLPIKPVMACFRLHTVAGRGEDGRCAGVGRGITLMMAGVERSRAKGQAVRRRRPRRFRSKVEKIDRRGTFHGKRKDEGEIHDAWTNIGVGHDRHGRVGKGVERREEKRCDWV